MPAISQVAALLGATLFLTSTHVVNAKSTDPPKEALPSYHYGAPIPVECMNRSM